MRSGGREGVCCGDRCREAARVCRAGVSAGSVMEGGEGAGAMCRRVLCAGKGEEVEKKEERMKWVQGVCGGSAGEEAEGAVASGQCREKGEEERERGEEEKKKKGRRRLCVCEEGCAGGCARKRFSGW